MNLARMVVGTKPFLYRQVAVSPIALLERSMFLHWARNTSNCVSRHGKVINTIGSSTQRCLVSADLGTVKEQRRTLAEDTKTKALALIKDLKHLQASPPPALILGISGLIPFLAAPSYMIMSGYFVTNVAFSQVAYGACILSFIGGVRWGMAIPKGSSVEPNWSNIGYSVTPSLVAWVGLMLPTSLSIITVMGGLAGSAYMDMTMEGYPEWFKALRFLLSIIAILALWTTLMCRLTLSDVKKVKKEPKSQKSEKVSKQIVVKEPRVDVQPAIVKSVEETPPPS